MSISKSNLDCLTALYATSTFQRILSGGPLDRELLLAAQVALINARIPFDVVYTEPTGRVPANAQLVINVNPNLRITFIFFL
ncbi:hypothetical protein EDC19_0479 [Natranaerovirga hydrolytica]|uniref:Uncharacterized protein n=1 Tax=Natranaerovirga hydrolytica TaxID=680378 RepID=A0A4R1MZQ5_9FIRM|nr:hypothetical protein [Natranaerovirga hydrolytica]TCK98062.1 hypothetical protein EDC19_0479 [Natranaerovirga hydrolytica]